MLTTDSLECRTRHLPSAPDDLWLPTTVASQLDELIDDVLTAPRATTGEGLVLRLHALAHEARRTALGVDALVLALHQFWVAHAARARIGGRESGERFVRVAHAMIREYLRLDARWVSVS